MCRKPVSAAQVLHFKAKPRPVVPGSPRKGSQAAAAAAETTPSGAGNALAFRPSTKLRALLKELAAMTEVEQRQGTGRC